MIRLYNPQGASVVYPKLLSAAPYFSLSLDRVYARTEELKAVVGEGETLTLREAFELQMAMRFFKLCQPGALTFRNEVVASAERRAEEAGYPECLCLYYQRASEAWQSMCELVQDPPPNA